MIPMLAELVAPFARISEVRAAEALGTHWGITDSRLERLDTERDDTFRVRRAAAASGTGGPGDLLLKIAHPDDEAAVLDLQNTALRAVADREPDLPVPRLVATRARAGAGSLAGDDSAIVDGRITRVLTWLPGTLMIETPQTPAQLEAAGRMLGRLSRILATVDTSEHPAAHRVLAWDLQRLPLLRDEAAESDPSFRAFIERIADEVSPALAALPHQLVHNDFHPANVLVDPAHPDTVLGVLDFGDVVHTARVADVAVALAYLVPNDDDVTIAAAWEPFLAGYAESVTLESTELALLPRLAAARQVQRVVINDALARAQNEIREAPVLRRKLQRILTEFGLHTEETP